MAFSRQLMAAFLVSSAVGALSAGEPHPTPSPDTSAQASGVLRQALPAELTKLFPIGREFKGVAIPSYEETRLKSVMHADTIIRVDKQFLDLTNLVIHVYNGAGEHETTISMDEAAYDLTVGVLTSKTPSEIKQPRFTMTGDKMIFNSNTQVSELEGNVKVVVPNAGKMIPKFGMPGLGGK